MQGKSHLLVGLTAGIILDSVVNLTGDPLTIAKTVPLILLVKKAIFYWSVGFGALLPDIDNARSTMGHKFGRISKEIQHLAGHRTLFHSLLGLCVGSLLAIGLEQVVIYILTLRGLVFPALFVASSHLVFFGILFGCIMHIAADGLTTGGVPLFWPNHRRYGFPPSHKMRFRTGTWPESVIVWSFMIVVAAGIFLGVIII